MKDVRQSLENYRKAIAEMEQLVTGDPNNTQRQSQLAGGLMDFAVVLTKAGKRDEARKAAARGLEIQRSLVKREEVSSGELAQYARSLLDCEPPDLRNPKMAVEVARHAAEMTKFEDSEILDTLAQAYFASGDATHAVQTEQKALTLSGATTEPSTAASAQKEYRAHLGKYQARLQRK